MAVLKKGMKGSAVKKLQSELNKAGAKPKLEMSGTFDDKTDAAVRAFQKGAGLKVDGKAGPNTMGALETGGKQIDWTIKDTARAMKQLKRKSDDAIKSRVDIAVLAGKHHKNKDVQFAYRSFDIYAEAYAKELHFFKKDLERIEDLKMYFNVMHKGKPREQAADLSEAQEIWKGLERRNRNAQKLSDAFDFHHDAFLASLDTALAEAAAR